MEQTVVSALRASILSALAGLCQAETSFISMHQVAPATATANARVVHCCSSGVAVMNSIIPLA